MIEENFLIRKATMKDFTRILEIFEYARRQMKINGNPDQWKDNRPQPNQIISDIENQNCYVMEDEGRIFASYAFIIGCDSTYLKIYDGAWLNDEPYGTIHRIAGDGTHKGVLKRAVENCLKSNLDIRIDTHEDNKIMRHLLEKNGFQHCGVILLENGEPRLAFQRRKE